MRVRIEKRRKAAGQCVACGHGELETKTLCKVCAAKMREYGAKSYQARKQNGICVRCHHHATPGKVMCEPCEVAVYETRRRQIRELQSENAVLRMIVIALCARKGQM